MAMAVAPVVSYTGQKASEVAHAIAEDPWGWTSRALIKTGLGLLVGGFVIGTTGYFLAAEATKAGNAEKALLGSMGNIWSNIKAPSWKPAPSGTAPLTFSIQGVEDLGSDLKSDFDAGMSDLGQIGGAIGTVGEDIVQAVCDIGKTLFAFVTHFPQLTWNGLVWTVGGGMADLMNWAFPYLVLLGAALLVAGVLMMLGKKAAAPLEEGASRSFAKWRERRAVAAERFFDRALRNPAPPVLEAVPAAEAQRTQTEEVGGGGFSAPHPTESVPAEPGPPSPSPETPGDTAPEAPAVSGPPEVTVEVSVPPPAGVPTRQELEDHLGEVPNRAPTPEEMAKMLVEAEANRRASMPKGPSGYAEMRRAQAAFDLAETA